MLLIVVATFVVRRRRAIHGPRPWEALGEHWEDAVTDPLDQLTRSIEWLQDTLIVPVNDRLPGSPFEYDIQAFPFTPMVLVIGNHSSGKSTFINHLLGVEAQDTGVAPTDDGFTVLERYREAEIEDGPTLLGCSENRPFKDLQRFGRAFSGHLRRKRLVLPESSAMPYGLQIVDTPGMIDMPGNGQVSAKSRGYNFIEVVRWWAKKADLILLLFDPDKPGTTGETLEVLTKSLAGLAHKFVILLNKVDRLDNPVDFARAYGTLGWALSKVIPQKDIPQIWTTYNADKSHPVGADDREHTLPLEAFRRKREEVVTEVLRARVRHWDNVITSLEEALRQIEMMVRVCRMIRGRAVWHLVKVWMCGLPAFIIPAVVAAWLYTDERFDYDLPERVVEGACGVYIFFLCAVVFFLWDYSRQGNRLQTTHLDDCFQQVYAHVFVHADSEDHRLRWCVVRPKIENLLRAVRFAFALPYFSQRDAARIKESLENDMMYLRRLAKLARPAEPTVSTPSFERRPQTHTPSQPPAKVSHPLSEPPAKRASEKSRAVQGVRAQDALAAEDTSQKAVDASPEPLDVRTLKTGSGGGSSAPSDEKHAFVRRARSLNTIAEEETAAVPPIRRAKTDQLLERLEQLDKELAAARKQGQPETTSKKPQVLSLSSQQQPSREAPDAQEAASDTLPTPDRATMRTPPKARPVGAQEPQPLEVGSVQLGCICGYTCGTSKALERHLTRFADDSRHAPQYALG